MQIQKLSQDRDITETKLQCNESKLQRNERDCVVLSEMQNVHDKGECQILQEIIDDKKEKLND